jgi:hypothetical protein
MSLTKTLREIFRDYVTDNVPASGVNPPSKADIRQWGSEVETLLAEREAVVSDQIAFALNRLEIARRSVPFQTAI